MERIKTTTIKDLLDRYPDAVQVFIDHRLWCVGCPAEKFHTVRDSARNHKLDLDQFTRSLQKVITSRSDDYSPPSGQDMPIV